MAFRIRRGLRDAGFEVSGWVGGLTLFSGSLLIQGKVICYPIICCYSHLAKYEDGLYSGPVVLMVINLEGNNNASTGRPVNIIKPTNDIPRRQEHHDRSRQLR